MGPGVVRIVLGNEKATGPIDALTAILLAAGLLYSRIRHACMDIGLLEGVLELARIHRRKRNYAAELGRCKLDGHSSSDN
jgi:hypothetical protein